MALLIHGCSRKSVPLSGNTVYTEDLSILHPVIKSEAAVVRPKEAEVNTRPGPVNSEHDITEEMDSLMLIIAEKNLQKRYTDGFTVQVYSGPNREQANRARSEVQMLGLDSPSQVVYVQPNFKVKVGRFYTRLEANKVFSQIREVFPDALLLPEKIPVE